MSNNLHISYDLREPGKNYQPVIDKIKSLGDWAKIHQSYWFVKSTMSAMDAAKAVWSVMDATDSVYVVDSTKNDAGWYNISQEASDYIRAQWLK